MTDVFNAVQTAIYERLQPVLAALPGGVPVFDDVQQKTDYPYAVIGDDQADEWDTKTSCGLRHDITVDVWSRYDGRKEVKTILGAIYTALHNQPITVAGQQAVWCYFQFKTDFLEPDGETRHGVIRFEIATTEQA